MRPTPNDGSMTLGVKFLRPPIRIAELLAHLCCPATQLDKTLGTPKHEGKPALPSTNTQLPARHLPLLWLEGQHGGGDGVLGGARCQLKGAVLLQLPHPALLVFLGRLCDLLLNGL